MTNQSWIGSHKRRRKLLSMFGVLTALLLIFAACSSSTPSGNGDASGERPADSSDSGAADDGELKLTIVGSDVGGSAYLWTSAIGFHVSEKVENLSITPTTSGGLVENIRLLSFGEADIGLTTTPAAYDSVQGLGPFEGEDYSEDYMVVGFLGEFTYSFVTLADSDIHSLTDLAGKRISMGAPGSGSAVEGEKILRAVGVWDELAEVLYLGYEDSASALRDGQIDAFVQGGTSPMPAIAELATIRQIRLLPIEGEVDEALARELPYLARMTLPGGTYDNYDEDVVHVSGKRFVIVRPDVPEWAVEEITRILYTDEESQAHLAGIHPVFEELPNYEGLAELVESIGLTFHPGAEKVWRELGVIE